MGCWAHDGLSNLSSCGAIKSVKARLSEFRLALAKLTNESSRTEVNIWSEMSAIEETLRMEKTRVERLERVLTTEADKRQQLLAERRWTSKTASCQLSGDEGSIQDLRPTIVATTAERDE